MPSLPTALCLLLWSSGNTAAAALAETAPAGSVEIVIYDGEHAVRTEAVRRWLAAGLAMVLPEGGVSRIEVERRSMRVLVAVEGDRLLVHPRLPSASRDEQLQVLRAALWILLRPELGSEMAWSRALELVAPLRPVAAGPRWWPHCCEGLDAQQLPPSPSEIQARPLEGDDPDVSAPEPAGRRPFGRADIYGAFRTPLGGDWPWVVGGAGIWAPFDRWELVGGLEGMPQGLVELRLGAGWARWERRILRLDGGALLAWNPGSVLPEDQRQEGHRYPAGVEAGLWADAELGGWRGLVRILPDEQVGIDAWVGWERRFALAERWYLLPFTRARYVSACLPERALSSGGSWGVRWMPTDALLTDRILTVRGEVEHVIPTGRMPGPDWLRPRAVLLRAGADGAWSADTGLVSGWAGSLGLAMNPLREIKGVAWLILATPPDFSSVTWFVWFGTWMPRP